MSVMPNTPPSRVAACEDCHQPIDVDSPGTAQFVEGWAVNRSAGGANMIALRTPQRRWLCPPCLDLRRSGKTDQGSLL